VPRQCKDWLNSYMQFTENTESPILFREWVGVCTIAACLQRRVVLEMGHVTVYPNFYVVLIGPPGGSRKSTAMAPGKNLLKKAGIVLSAEATTREALIRALKETTDTNIDLPTGNVTMHSSLTIFTDELTVFLGHNNLDFISVLCQWFDCHPDWEYKTKTQGKDHITGVWVNLVGATTPDAIQSALPRDAIGGGLTSRIIFVYEPRKGKIQPLQAFTKEEIIVQKQLIADMTDLLLINKECTTSVEWYSNYTEWYLRQEANPPFIDNPFLAAYGNRRQVFAIKLSMVMNASRGGDMHLEEQDLARAIDLLERVERKMPHTFSGVGKSHDTETCAKILHALEQRKTMSSSDIMKMFHQDITGIGELKRMLITLESIRTIRIEKKYNEEGYEELIHWTGNC